MTLAYAAATLVSIPPWIDYFSTGLGEHWDTRLMGQWLAWNASNILQAKVLLPDFNANFFYPHASSLAFSEALWPQSFVYAALSALGFNHFFCFNATMLIFWAISGITMYALLRYFHITRSISFLGGMIFCLMPYRLAYYIEFNMTLVFCIPLIWLAWFRWIDKPALGTSIFVVIVYWLTLTSCIYYTLIALVPVLFLFIAELRTRPGLFKDRQFLIWSGVLLLTIAVQSLLFLRPYIELSTGDYVRDAADHARHYLQAVHYINPQSPLIDYFALGLNLRELPVRLSEVLAFPGTVLALLACIYWISSTQQRIEDSINGGRWAIHATVHWCRTCAWIVFWFCIFRYWLSDAAPSSLSGQLIFWSATVVLVISTYTLLLPVNDDLQRQRLTSLGAASIVCFFISLGPDFTLGHDDHSTFLSANPIGWAFEAIKLFDALRGLSRFAIVVLCFLIVAGVYTLHGIVNSQRIAVFVVCLLTALLIFEGRQGFYRYVDETENLNSETSQAIDALPIDVPLVQIPLGIRDSDAEAVLMTAVVTRPLINGHSGFAPVYYQDWNELMRQWQIEEFVRDLSNIWPTPWIVLNHAAINFLSNGWRAEFPDELIERDWELVVTDKYRSLYKPRPLEQLENNVDRWLRRDVLAAHSVISFEASVAAINTTDEAPQFSVLVNEVEVARRKLRTGTNSYRTELDLSAVPAGRLRGDSVSIRLDKTASWRISNVQFEQPLR